MNWTNVRLILSREIRDQLRDRRTLFMIAVLPLLLYPLLGMSVFQLSQFLRKSEPKVLVVGSEQLAEDADLPPLFVEGQFAPGLFNDPAEAERLHVAFAGEAQLDDRAADVQSDSLPHEEETVETLGDEVLTPDSSRFWPAEGFAIGRGQPSFDKQFVRDWASGTGWDKQPPAPPIPDDVVAATRAKYVEAYELITGESFDAWLARTAP